MKKSELWPLGFSIPVLIAMWLILTALLSIVGFDAWHSIVTSSAIVVMVTCAAYLYVDNKHKEDSLE